MINLIHIGLGSWGPNLARNFQRTDGCRIRMLCDTRKERYEILRGNFPGAEFRSDYRDCLRDDGIDAVSIATDAGTHYEIARQFLQSGKHVFVEKPLALSAHECLELCRLAALHKRVLMTGHVFLYNPAVLKLKELYESGELGELHYLYSQRLNLGKVRADVDVVWNFAPHDISIVMYLLGEEITKVSARGISILRADVCDVAFIHLMLRSGKTAHVHLSWIDPQKIRTLTLVGSRKMAVYDDIKTDRKIRIFDKGIDKKSMHASFGEFDNFGSFQFLTRAGDIYTPKIDPAEPLYSECNHFLECILKSERPLSDGVHGMRVVEVLEAVSASIRNDGGWIPVNYQTI